LSPFESFFALAQAIRKVRAIYINARKHRFCGFSAASSFADRRSAKYFFAKRNFFGNHLSRFAIRTRVTTKTLSSKKVKKIKNRGNTLNEKGHCFIDHHVNDGYRSADFGRSATLL
jgi:hypothetical protein